MKNLTKYVPWTIRILISLLFIVSAAAKLYPAPYFAITTFEVKQLYTLGFSEAIAPFFSRILIGIEFALGFLLLNNHFLKRITVPATLLMLSVFTIHLTVITYFSGGNQGNCGCFGELIPMTPIEAILKNVIAIALLIFLLFLLKNKPDIKSNFWILTTVTFASILGVFMITFNQPSTKNQDLTATDVSDNETVNATIDSSAIDQNAIKSVSEIANSTVSTKTTSKIDVEKQKIVAEQSGYAKYFSDIDNGVKIICFFVPGCDHCRATAKEITALSQKDKNFPKVQIIFMDEEADKIPDFFAEVGAKYDYKIVDIIGFWKILGSNKDVPGVKILKNGKDLKYFFGTTENAFNASETLKLINNP